MKDFGQLPTILQKFFRSRRVPAQDVGDLTQETLLRVLRCSREESLDSFEAFAIGVAKRVLCEYWRRARKAQLHRDISDVVELAGHSNPQTDALRRERGALCHKALARLPERTGRLLVKRFIEGVPRTTLAREERVSTAAIDVRVCRAKRELKKRVGLVARRGGSVPMNRRSGQ